MPHQLTKIVCVAEGFFFFSRYPFYAAPIFNLGGRGFCVSEPVGRYVFARAPTENPCSVFFFRPALQHPHIGDFFLENSTVGVPKSRLGPC